jgi:hypothetical protein
VPAGGGVVADLIGQVPSPIILVDHAATRAFYRGAIGFAQVTGPENTGIFEAIVSPQGSDRGCPGKENPASAQPCHNLSMTDTRELTKPKTSDPTDGDGDNVAHYVRKDDIVRSNVEGVPVKALCGKEWIPHRVPDGLPVCATCKKVMASLRGGGAN